MSYTEQYEAAAHAVAKAVAVHAEARRTLTGCAWRALLSPLEFHEEVRRVANRVAATPDDPTVMECQREGCNTRFPEGSTVAGYCPAHEPF